MLHQVPTVRNEKLEPMSRDLDDGHSLKRLFSFLLALRRVFHRDTNRLSPLLKSLIKERFEVWQAVSRLVNRLAIHFSTNREAEPIESFG